MAELNETALRVFYSLSNVDTAGGGLHIHVGTNCNGSAGSHYWTPSTAADPWTTTYSNYSSGVNTGYFDISGVGYTLTQNLGHAVVLYDNAGTFRVM